MATSKHREDRQRASRQRSGQGEPQTQTEEPKPTRDSHQEQVQSGDTPVTGRK